MKPNNPTVVERDVKCPYCQSPNAILINKEDGMKTGVGLPAYGLKSLLCFMYLSIIHIAMNGLRLFQITRKKFTTSYIFCPECGNSVSANAPEEIKEENEAPKLYRIRKGKLVTGLSKGISEYTGIPVLWVRICNLAYAATGIYFLVAACISFKEDAEAGIVDDRKFVKAKNGKWIFGICKGVANYTEIPVVWIRIWTCILGLCVLPAIAYLVIGLAFKKEEE